MTHVDDLYARLCTSASSSPMIQWRMFYRASKNHGALVALCNLPDLDPALDIALGKVPDAKVRAAWITRTGRSAAAIAACIAADNRVVVLQSIAVLADLPEVAYEALAQVKRPKVALALLRNSSVPLAVKAVALSHVVGANLPYGERYSLGRALKEEPGLATTVADLGNRRLITATPQEHFLAADLTSVGQNNVFTEMVERPLGVTAHGFHEELSKGRWAPHRQSRMDQDIADPLAFARGLAGLPNLDDRLRVRLQDLVTAATFNDPSRTVPGYAAITEALTGTSTVGESLAPLFRAGHSDNPEELAQLAEQAVTDEDADLFRAVSANPHSRPQTLIAGVALLRTEEQPRLAWRHPDHLELFVTCLLASPHSVTDEGLALSPTPTLALGMIMDRLIASGRSHSIASGHLASAFMTAELLMSLPLSYATRFNVSDDNVVAVQNYLTAQFGDCAENWALFESLSLDFDGSFQQLVDTVMLLGASDVPAAVPPAPEPPAPILAASPAHAVAVTAGPDMGNILAFSAQTLF